MLCFNSFLFLPGKAKLIPDIFPSWTQVTLASAHIYTCMPITICILDWYGLDSILELIASYLKAHRSLVYSHHIFHLWIIPVTSQSREELAHLKRPWCWERLRAGGEADDRGWDGWMTSPTQWTWVWVNSGSWWWTRRPYVLWFMGSQRVRHDWAAELNWSELMPKSSLEGKNL